MAGYGAYNLHAAQVNTVMLQNWLQRAAIYAVFCGALYLHLGLAAGLLLLTLLVLLENLAAQAGAAQGLNTILNLPKGDILRLKDLLTRAEQGAKIDPDEIRRIFEQKGD